MEGGKAAAPARKPSFGTRAWRLLRLAVLWARRGGAAHSLRLLRTLRRHGHGLGGGARGEREFSIDETPAFRFRTPSARVLRLIPCIAPETPGLYGDDRYFFRDAAARALEEDDDARAYGGSSSYGADQLGSERAGGGDDEEEDVEELSCYCDDGDDEQLLERAVAESCRASTAAEGDAGVDVKADEFIARFYAQMKLQRQISWLQYNEMMQRSVS